MLEDRLLTNFKGQAIYQITVDGKVDKEAIDQLNSFKITHRELPNKTLSILSGKIEDQAALRGLVNLLANNNYKVNSIIKLIN